MRRVAVIVAVAFAAACGGGDDGGSEATEAIVLETCAPGAVPVEVQVCRCAFRELAERFDAEELARIDRQLRDDPESVPPEVQEIVLACGFEPVSPPSTKPALPSDNGDESTPTDSRP